jgi:hypothetical protein
MYPLFLLLVVSILIFGLTFKSFHIKKASGALVSASEVAYPVGAIFLSFII